jgi:hypothetical protein
MKKVALIITIFITCLSTGCEKEDPKEAPKDCWSWYAGDVFGLRYPVDQRCNVTEEEFLNSPYPGGSGTMRTNVGCNYQGALEPVFCWEVKFANATTYTGNYCNLTEREANCLLTVNGNLIRKK